MMIRISAKVCAIALSVVIFSFHPLFASAETALPVLRTKARTIAVFKNGLGFFTREGTTGFRDGWAVTELVPKASLGSLWIGSLDENTRLEEVVGFHEENKRDIEAISIEELLEANPGKKVKVTYGENKTVEGVIKSVPKTRQPEKTESPAGNNNLYGGDPRYLPKPASIVVLDTGNGDVVLNKSAITKLDFIGEMSATYPVREKVKRVKFRTSTSKKEGKFALSYLQKGITWVPSYLVNIEDPAKARITLKATLVNDIEDIDGVDMFFIAGYPNFMYADILSPMAMEESLTQFMRSLTREGRSDEDRFGAITRQRVDFRYNEESVPRADQNYGAMREMAGTAEEDLFYYSKESATVKKGERAEYHIFSSEVDYRHVYEWDVPDTINVDLRGNQVSSREKSEKEQVWHSLKLTNATKYPWTTAPALVMSQWKPLSQDTLNYTSRNSSTNLKMTIATDVRHERQEHETERQRDLKLYNYNYDLVTVEGGLKIKNLKDREVTMEIRKRTIGEVIEASHKGKIEKTAEGLKGVNQNSKISWEIPLKAGEEINVTYRYKVYIAR